MEKIQEINDVCKEVLTILGFFDSEIIEKIPSKVFKNLTELSADSKLNFYIDRAKNLYEQDISEKSKDLIALLYYTYIADSNEKHEIWKIWNENEKTYQEELNEKFNSDILFKKVHKQEASNIELLENKNALIEYKESFFIRFKNFLFKILHI